MTMMIRFYVVKSYQHALGARFDARHFQSNHGKARPAMWLRAAKQCPSPGSTTKIKG